MTVLLSLVLSLLLSSSAAWSATYHVSLSGNDTGTGITRCNRATSASTPLLTINVASACAGPGDTVKVGPGTFAQRVDLNATAGGSAAGGHVFIEGAKPVGPTVTDKTGSTRLYTAALGNVFTVYGRHVKYVTFRNFEIQGAGGGIGVFGSFEHVTLSDNYLHDNRADVGALSAIRGTAKYILGGGNANQSYGPEFGSASYLTIARNHIYNWTTGFNQTLSGNGTETLSVTADLERFLIEDNLIDTGHFIALDMIGKSVAWWDANNPNTLPIPPESWPRKGIVRRNTIKNVKLGMGGGDLGIYCDGCKEIVVEQNRVDGCNGYCFGISTEEGDFHIAQFIVRHNIGINCTSTPFGIGPAATGAQAEHVRVVHNTALRPKPGGPTWRFQHAGGAQAKNNIGAVASASPVPYLWHGFPGAGDAPTLNYNLWWGGNNFWQYRNLGYLTFASYQAGSGQDAQGLVADPLFTNVATRDLSLQATSPALNRGTVLTQTVGAGSGTLVTVQDARYFMDGYGLVEGDPIQIGTQQARVLAVNYATNQITLDRPTLSWTTGMGVSYPYLGSAPDIGACEGVGTCALVAPPVVSETPTPAPAVALDLTHTCATASNSLSARVHGSLFYLAPGAVYEAPMLARSSCASDVAITESASVPARPLLPPWHFLGTAGPNVSNTCTNCLSVHGGTPSINASGSGYTLTTFKEGTSVTAATGGSSAYAALPSLCRQVVDGVVTSAPLWPWPMEARIAAARTLSGSAPVNVTQAVEAALGPIPASCRVTPPVLPPPQTIWVIARSAASPPGVDGAACTVEAPCATLAHVASRMGTTSGQTVYLRGGMYSQRITPGMFPPGTSWGVPTTIAAYGGEAVTLQLTTGILVALTDPAKDRYLLFEGITLDGSAATSTTTQGLIVGPGAGPIRWQRGAIRTTALERVILDGSQGVELLDATISGGTGFAAVRVQGATHGTVLQRLVIETSPAEGVQVVGQDHTQLRVSQNRIRTNVGTGLVLGATLLALGTTEALVDTNLITGNGAGVQVGFGALGNKLYNNTIADNTGVGLQIDEGASSTQVVNTILWGNGSALVDAGEDTVLTTTMTSDPGFEGGGSYKIASGTSPAVDTGTSLTEVSVALDDVVRPQGAGWDVGSYERSGEPGPVLPTPGALSARPYSSKLLFVP